MLYSLNCTKQRPNIVLTKLQAHSVQMCAIYSLCSLRPSSSRNCSSLQNTVLKYRDKKREKYKYKYICNAMQLILCVRSISNCIFLYSPLTTQFSALDFGFAMCFLCFVCCVFFSLVLCCVVSPYIGDLYTGG